MEAKLNALSLHLTDLRLVHQRNVLTIDSIPLIKSSDLIGY